MNPLMAGPADRVHRAVRQLRRMLLADAGFSLVELIVVMVVMLAVLAPLTYSFIAADRAQVDQTRRFDAQQNARQALDRMRKDIHCAHAANDPYANASGGQTLLLTETNNGVAECPGLVQTSASAVQWCTIPVSGFTNRYRLYRENDPNTTCDGSASTFMVDYLTRPDLWASPTCVSGQYATVDLTMPVDTEASSGGGSYSLADEIAIRNGDICP
jgi:prepilin-type N-terminal cleavage/methylation domain-containing protein